MGTTSASSSDVVGSKSMDSSNPYYLHHSDSLRMSLVNSIFEGKGYGDWRRTIIIALSAKNKLGFIDGGCKAPGSDSSDLKLRERTNNMVTSWLLYSLSKEIAESVIYSKIAEALWKDLEDRFGQPNRAKLYHLQKELNDLVQGSNDIARYYTRLKGLWNELDLLNTKNCCSWTCTYGGKNVSSKALQDERLILFLMGLNDAYSPARSTILMINALPSKIIGTSDIRGRKTDLLCSHCKKPGYTVDKCYRIVGFPSDFKFTGSKKITGNMKSNAIAAPGEGDDELVQENSLGMNQLSKEKFSQLIQLLHQVKVSQSEPALSDVSANSASKNHSVSCHILIKSSKWILDTGASEHLFSNPELFTYPSPLTNPIYVNFPDSSKGPSMKRPLALGEVRDVLYQLGSTSLSSKKRVQHRDLATRTSCLVSVSSSVVIKGNSDAKLWHNRLRFPSRVLKGLSPYEVLYKQPPTYTNLRSFGCFCFASTLSQSRPKFHPRDLPCVFLGYPTRQKGYKLMSLKSRKIISSRDAKFIESIFPFKNNSNPSSTPVGIFYAPHSQEQDIPNDPSVFSYSSPQESTPLVDVSPSDSPSSANLHTPFDVIPTRQSSRIHKKPSYLSYYVCNAVYFTNLTQSCCTSPISPSIYPFAALSSINQNTINFTLNISEPTSFSQASMHPGW
ncbi:uncharacterized protein [Solanum tuberosum]|uniref:uncharacterized protein n=1 Tax=Solanum tuberosum TaxID=4113 RepID=UPI00073A26DC|nr:PREDICTED: uncharacterized protein LOC107058319 [Solanum tuberosum]